MERTILNIRGKDEISMKIIIKITDQLIGKNIWKCAEYSARITNTDKTYRVTFRQIYRKKEKKNYG